jgi:hypothetical protein
MVKENNKEKINTKYSLKCPLNIVLRAFCILSIFTHALYISIKIKFNNSLTLEKHKKLTFAVKIPI